MLATLHWLNGQFPGLFAAATAYDTPLFEVLEQIRELSLTSSEIRDRLEQPQKLIEIRANVTKESVTIDRTMNPQALQQLRNQLSREIPRDSGKVRDEFLYILQTYPLAIRLNGILTGLAMRLTPEEKRHVFRLNSLDRATYFAEKFPNGLPAHFKRETHGIPADMSDAEIFYNLLSGARAEERLQQLGFLLVLLHGQTGSPQDNVAKLNSQNLDLLKEKARVPEVMEHLRVPSPEPVRAWLDQQLNLLFKHLAGQTVEKKVVIAGALTLRQVHPLVAAFRGFPANDCSTLYSALYGLIPSEITFHILDNEGKIKGVVSMSMTTVQGHENIYLHTISGPRASGADAEIVMRTIYNNRHLWGANTVTLPTVNQLEGLVNAVGPRMAMAARAQRGRKVVQTPDDRDLRLKIDGIHSGVQYDKVRTNGEGHLLEYEADEAFNIESKVRQTTERLAIPENISRGDAAMFAFEQMASERSETAERIFKVLGISKSQSSIDYAVLLNPKLTKVEAFQATVAQLLKKYGVDNPTSVIKDRPSLTKWGRIEAPDAFEPAHLDDTVRALILLVDQQNSLSNTRHLEVPIREIDLPPFARLIFSKMRYLRNHPLMIKYVNSLLDDIGDDDEDLIAEHLIQLGYPLANAVPKLIPMLTRFLELAEGGENVLANPAFQRTTRIAALGGETAVRQLVQDLFASGINFKRILILKDRLHHTLFHQIVYIGVLHAQSRDEALEILAEIPQGSLFDCVEVGRLLALMRPQLKKFGISPKHLDSLHPNTKMLHDAYIQMSESQTPREYVSHLLELRNDFRTTLAIPIQAVRDSYKHFVTLKPKVRDWQHLLSVTQLRPEILKAALLSARSMDEVLELASWNQNTSLGVSSWDQQSAYGAVFSSAAAFKHLRSLKPTKDQVTKVIRMIDDERMGRFQILSKCATTLAVP